MGRDAVVVDGKSDAPCVGNGKEAGPRFGDPRVRSRDGRWVHRMTPVGQGLSPALQA